MIVVANATISSAVEDSAKCVIDYSLGFCINLEIDKNWHNGIKKQILTRHTNVISNVLCKGGILSVNLLGPFVFCVIQPTLTGIRMSEAGQERERETKPGGPHCHHSSHLAPHMKKKCTVDISF